MSSFVPFNRDQAFPLPPDLRSWLPENDVAHFVVAAVDRVPLGAFEVPTRTGGKPQCHPRPMRALLIHCCAQGLFSSRRIERAAYRDAAVRFVAANLHPDRDTVAAFRRANKAAIEAAFLHVLPLAREAGLLRLGTVSVNGAKLDANASKFRSVRHGRAQELHARLAADIAALVAKAEAADAADHDPQALPAELARREVLKAELDAAGVRLEAEARPRPKRPNQPLRPEGRLRLQDRAPRTAAKAAGRHTAAGSAKQPDRPGQDPDSALMRRSDAHEHRQAYNAQAMVRAEGAQLTLATNLAAATADAPSFAQTVLGMEATVGLPSTVPADTGFAGGPAVAALQARGIEPLAAIGRTQEQRPCDFRLPPDPKPVRQITEPWRRAMRTRLEEPADGRVSGFAKPA